MRETSRMQLVKLRGRKTGQKLTRRIIECKLVEYLQKTHRGTAQC